jgi:ubiquitin carboxyl-terminal hydrolase 14
VLNAAESSLPKKQLTGVYDLVAVLTHKGRSADSGHYVGWVKQDDGQSTIITVSFYYYSY